MRTGELARRITIKRVNNAKDTFGQITPTWIDVVSCWARIEPLAGRELITAQAVNSEVTHRVVIRYRPGITAAMRIDYGSRIFNILSVLNTDEDDRELVISASEGLNKG